MLNEKEAINKKRIDSRFSFSDGTLMTCLRHKITTIAKNTTTMPERIMNVVGVAPKDANNRDEAIRRNVKSCNKRKADNATSGRLASSRKTFIVDFPPLSFFCTEN